VTLKNDVELANTRRKLARLKARYEALRDETSDDEELREATMESLKLVAKTDWKYEKSKAGEAGGGRTHTFGVKQAARKLQGKAVYRRKDVVIRGGKPIPKNGPDESEDAGSVE
jgi:hypothetical protein